MQPFDPRIEGFQERLYEIYREYRENRPVYWEWEPLPSTKGSWCFFCYADVSLVLKDPRFVREYGKLFPGSQTTTVDPPEGQEPPPLSARPLTFWEMASRWMLFRDPPDHTRLRRLVNKAFTPRAIAGFANRVEAIAQELLRPGLLDGGMDLIEAFAFPLPVIVVAEMLGVPAEDRSRFRTWSNATAAAMDSYWTEEEIGQRASIATGEIWEYLTHIIEKRRQNPGSDLLSALIAAREDEDRLSEDQLVAMAILLLVAGHETTVNHIGNGLAPASGSVGVAAA